MLLTILSPDYLHNSLANCHILTILLWALVVGNLSSIAK